MRFVGCCMRAALLACVAHTIVACASTPPSGVVIARGVSFELLAPESFGHSVALDQVVVFRNAGNQHSMHCALEIEPHELRLVALTPFETPAFRMTLRADGLQVENLVEVELPSDPRHILADLQLALWPNLPAIDGVQVRERTEGDQWVRELVRAGQIFVRIRRPSGAPWSSPLSFEHLERGYALTVETLRCETLSP